MSSIKILIDADGCPVRQICERVACENSIELLIFCDTSHLISSEYGKVFTISKGADSVDFALVNSTDKGDIVVTQDYGVASMALGKGAVPVHQSGLVYTNDNIEAMLLERHLSKQARRAKTAVRTRKIAKRTREDDKLFEQALRAVVEKQMSKHQN